MQLDDESLRTLMCEVKAIVVLSLSTSLLIQIPQNHCPKSPPNNEVQGPAIATWTVRASRHVCPQALESRTTPRQ